MKISTLPYRERRRRKVLILYSTLSYEKTLIFEAKLLVFLKSHIVFVNQ